MQTQIFLLGALLPGVVGHNLWQQHTNACSGVQSSTVLRLLQESTGCRLERSKTCLSQLDEIEHDIRDETYGRGIYSILSREIWS
jgi:hypothetical protein